MSSRAVWSGWCAVTERTINGIASGFTPLFDTVVQDVGLTGAVVFGRVWRHCQGKLGVCIASRERMARDVGLSIKSFNRWLRVLCEAGYLKDTTPQRRNRPHVYRDTGKARMVVDVWDAYLSEGQRFDYREDEEECNAEPV